VGHLRGVLSRKGAGREHHDGDRGRNESGVRFLGTEHLPDKTSPRTIQARSRYALCIEHAVTANMDDGQQLPPFIEDNVVWHVVRRLPNGRTLWRRIFFSSPVAG
jgi:hypothetical protein